MSVIIVIPARYKSQRFPGKPLAMLKGFTGNKKTLIERTWMVAKKVKGVNRVIIATDDIRIKKVADSFGAEVLMTSDKHNNGTERVAEVVKRLKESYSVVVNLQGDAPLTPPKVVEQLIFALQEKKLAMATPILACDRNQVIDLINDRKKGNVGATTVVYDKNKDALYFSKEVIPYINLHNMDNNFPAVYHHMGVYAYTEAALKMYLSYSVGKLETQEGLEQLRFLENGIRIRCVEFNLEKDSFWELNNQSDISKIENILKNKSIK